jgi:hypothetical protein
LPSGELPTEFDYAMVVGNIKPDNTVLRSQYNSSTKGVIRVSEIKEHRTIWNNNISRDISDTISYEVDNVPFSLVLPVKTLSDKNIKSIQIEVDEPLKASYLIDSLHLTFKNFKGIIFF